MATIISKSLKDIKLLIYKIKKSLRFASNIAYNRCQTCPRVAGSSKEKPEINLSEKKNMIREAEDRRQGGGKRCAPNRGTSSHKAPAREKG